MSCKVGELEEYTPECSCPCHLAVAPDDAGNTYCSACGVAALRLSYPERTRTPYPHERAIADGKREPKLPTRHVADYYFLTNGNNLDRATRQRFPSSEAAQREADRRNLAEVIAARGLDSDQEKRAHAFRKIATRGWWHDGEYWWIKAHGRYAVESYGDDCSSSWQTYESLELVRCQLEDGDGERVIDLDTGEDVPFRRTVSVEI